MVIASLSAKKTNEWYTPQKYIDIVRSVLGAIELDPASCVLANQVIQAERIYTLEDNGLAQVWTARTVFLNPPYGINNSAPGKMVDWINKLISEYHSGCTQEAILLVNALTDRKWFQPLYNFPICFLAHRIHFYNDAGISTSPQYGNAFVYLGEREDIFAQHFHALGPIIKQYK